MHTSHLIKAAIKHCDKQGTLKEHADKIGIAGGVEELRKLACEEGELHVMDKGMLSLHFLEYNRER